MILKKFKPINPSHRFRIILSKKGINIFNFKHLRSVIINRSGRNSSGCITIRHRGGGSFSFYKNVDLNRLYSPSGSLVDFTFDKKRTALIGLFKHDKSFSYRLIPDTLSLGSNIKTTFSYSSAIDSLGDTMPLGWIPNAKIVFNIELYPGSVGVIARSAGVFCKIMKQKKYYVELKLPSGLIRKFSPLCLATIGRSSNINHRFQRFSYAGYFRHLGMRPSVRGEAMNAVDHPHGGKTRGGKPAMSPWGKVMK